MKVEAGLMRPAGARTFSETQPVGALLAELPTGYLHSRLRRDGLAY